MKLYHLFFCVFLYACSNAPSYNNLTAGKEMIKFFADAKELKPNWSKENTLVYHLISEPDNLHPSNGNSSPRSEILFYTQRCLLYIDFKTGALVPGLVQSLPVISEDSLHYTYTLRNDVHWDDGNLLTSEDVVFTAKAFKCPLTNDPSVRFYWNNVKDIVPGADGRSFTIEMYKKHFQNISFLCAFPLLQRTFHDPDNAMNLFTLSQFSDTAFHSENYPSLVSWALNFNDDANGRTPERLNGLGMYKVGEWQSGQYISLLKKPDHWTKNSKSYLEKAYPDKIIFLLNKDEASQILDFRNQRMDVSTNCTVNTLLQLSSEKEFNENYNSALLPTFNYTYICFNEKPENRNVIFNDVNVRKAFAMLTPVTEIMKIAYRDYSQQCKRMISNVSPLKKEFDNTLKPVEQNVKAAEFILRKSGWIDTDGDGILDKTTGGKKISFTADLNYLTSSPEWKSMAVYISEQMAKSGIRIIPVGMEIKLLVEKAKNHDFDLMLGSWGGTGLPEDYGQLWHTNSWSSHGSNYSGFGNEDSDRLIESMKLELNDSLRTILSHKLQRLICADQPMVFLYSSMRRNVIHRRFGNQMIFAERPGILVNDLRLLSITDGITMKDEVQP